jgi:mRNA-degrading endonuclease YafQ of YafQ-DinJ toxin-antitoxin module
MKQLKYELSTTKRLDKKVRKIIKKNKKLDKRLRKVFKQLKKDPFYKGLKTHKVNSSKWGEIYSFRITKDLRVLWDFDREGLIIIIIDIGGHEGSKAVY